MIIEVSILKIPVWFYYSLERNSSIKPFSARIYLFALEVGAGNRSEGPVIIRKLQGDIGCAASGAHSVAYEANTSKFVSRYFIRLQDNRIINCDACFN